MTQQDDAYLIHEHGFQLQDFSVESSKEMVKLTLKLAKIEFPRSNTLYLQ